MLTLNIREFESNIVLEPYFIVDVDSNGLLILAIDKSIGVVQNSELLKGYSVLLNDNIVTARFENTINIGDGMTISDGLFVKNNVNPLYRCIDVNGDLVVGCKLSYIPSGGGGGTTVISKVSASNINPKLTAFGYADLLYTNVAGITSYVIQFNFSLTNTSSSAVSNGDRLFNIVLPNNITFLRTKTVICGTLVLNFDVQTNDDNIISVYTKQEIAAGLDFPFAQVVYLTSIN